MATGGKTPVAMVLITDFPYYRNLSNLKIFRIVLLTRVSASFFLREFSICSPSTMPPFFEVNKDSFLRTNFVHFKSQRENTPACRWGEDNVLIPLLLREAEIRI